MCGNFSKGVRKENLGLTKFVYADNFFRFKVLESYSVTYCEVLKSRLYLVLTDRFDGIKCF